MKRTALQRRTPLRAKSATKRRSAIGEPSKRSTYKRRDRHFGFMRWVKEFAPCVARHMGDCTGVIEADHVGARGLSHKSKDSEVMGICTGHHRARTDFSGPFKLYTKDMMRGFIADGFAATRRLAVAAGWTFGKEDDAPQAPAHLQDRYRPDVTASDR